MLCYCRRHFDCSGGVPQWAHSLDGAWVHYTAAHLESPIRWEATLYGQLGRRIEICLEPLGSLRPQLSSLSRSFLSARTQGDRLFLASQGPYGDQNNSSPRQSIRFPNFCIQFVLFLSYSQSSVSVAPILELFYVTQTGPVYKGRVVDRCHAVNTAEYFSVSTPSAPDRNDDKSSIDELSDQRRFCIRTYVGKG